MPCSPRSTQTTATAPHINSAATAPRARQGISQLSGTKTYESTRCCARAPAPLPPLNIYKCTAICLLLLPATPVLLYIFTPVTVLLPAMLLLPATPVTVLLTAMGFNLLCDACAACTSRHPRIAKGSPFIDPCGNTCWALPRALAAVTPHRPTVARVCWRHSTPRQTPGLYPQTPPSRLLTARYVRFNLANLPAQPMHLLTQIALSRQWRESVCPRACLFTCKPQAFHYTLRISLCQRTYQQCLSVSDCVCPTLTHCACLLLPPLLLGLQIADSAVGAGRKDQSR